MAHAGAVQRGQQLIAHREARVRRAEGASRGAGPQGKAGALARRKLQAARGKLIKAYILVGWQRARQEAYKEALRLTLNRLRGNEPKNVRNRDLDLLRQCLATDLPPEVAFRWALANFPELEFDPGSGKFGVAK